ncbi:MAG: peptidase M48 [Candidatus Dactylopiibacterium carminicum]|uniref:Peptidase M48 n=1 Tax=Candidatus Dactylopiibacterium carminicum TaxID=857335 RepID=A0A272ENE6_9RHOO|nr:M48 family metallopeptidase [Candidatus Dactylopiibacterium carminicum]KAF7599254.1 peptidase M48 [Candidatus Dactylopiibacterium carminicum]PAS91647.1 MAG: peptidase M48 [Candidatus Dactylopiibacterium carminicum]PAS97195.1 MAG: peptidase M48 [Candidatus Dactylopiibacterium carminicum]PAS99260.1 MAG: peptidase M48 [Candidatus Dactylopiibacterium carminicum]
MSASTVTALFLFTLLVSNGIRLWLSLRQARHVRLHRAAVPAEFAASIGLPAHQKAADYTLAKGRYGRLDLAWSLIWLLVLTLGGGLQWMHGWLAQWLDPAGLWHGMALFGLLSVLSFAWELPGTLYQTFGLEARFGFNQTTPAVFIADTAKSALLTVLIGAPLLWCVLWLMRSMGASWWLWTWALLIAFNLAAMVIYPLFIAPLFNKFEPLQDESLVSRINALLARCGFQSKGLFVMDGSRRSAHGNAYFTGFGAAKRIVFYDTLLKALTPEEVEAVLAHELGHFKHRHIVQRLVLFALLSLAFFAILGWLAQQPAFFTGLGVPAQSEALTLILFSLILGPFTFPLTPLMSFWSRKHEFEADAYAVANARAEDLVSALVKLYRDNASTLTPDPLHSLFYDSHPPAAIRIGRLKAAAV